MSMMYQQIDDIRQTWDEALSYGYQNLKFCNPMGRKAKQGEVGIATYHVSLTGAEGFNIEPQQAFASEVLEGKAKGRLTRSAVIDILNWADKAKAVRVELTVGFDTRDGIRGEWDIEHRAYSTVTLELRHTDAGTEWKNRGHSFSGCSCCVR